MNLIHLEKPGIKFNAVCDLQGNYKIDDIEPGRYLLIIKSKNTWQKPDYYYQLFKIYKSRYSAYQIKLADFRMDLQNQIDTLCQQQVDLTKDVEKSTKRPFKYLKAYDKLKADKILEQIL